MKLTGTLGLGVVGFIVLGGTAQAGFSVDDNLGFARDTLSGTEHLETPLEATGTKLINGTLRLDPAGLDEQDPNDTGSATTKIVSPAAFSDWNRFYFKASGSPRQGQTPQQMIVVEAVSEGDVVYPLTWVASDDPGYTGMADLSGLDPVALPGLRLRFTLNEAAINPAIDEWKLTWTPYSDLRITYAAPNDVCSGATISQQIAVGVNYVTARNVLVTVPLPTGTTKVPAGQDPAAFIAATRLSLQSVVPSQGGATGPSPLTLASGQVVPAHTAYVFLGDVEPGSTFQILMTMTSPFGTLADTSYSLAATVRASNADTKTSAPRTIDITADPEIYITKRAVTGVYTINQTDYANPDTYVGFEIRIEQPLRSTCRDHDYNIAVWDSLDLLSAQGRIPFATSNGRFIVTGLSQGGAYAEAPTTLYTTGPDNTPIDIPQDAVYWTIPKLTVGRAETLSFAVKLADGATFPLPSEGAPRDVVTNVAYADSGFTPQATLRQSAKPIAIHPPQTPSGIYGKGKASGGYRQVTAGADDLPGQTVTYLDVFSWVVAASNGGFSDLEGHFFFDMVPLDPVTGLPRIEVLSVSAPPGATVYYTDVAGFTDPNAPPGFDAGAFAPPAQPNPLVALDTSVWSTLPPAGGITAATWVAIYVPKIGSPFRQNEPGAAPSYVSADITVRVKAPTSSCESFTIANRARFETLGYRTTTGELRDANLAGSDLERMQVVPITPWLANASTSISPKDRIGPGPVTFSFYIPNYRIGGTPVDTAMNPEAIITLPQIPVNGVPTYLQVLSATGGPGSTATQLPGGKVRIVWANILPGEAKTATVTVQVPVGVLPDESLSFSAAAVGYDDVCGPANANGSEVATTTFRPHLKVVKGSKYDIVAAGAAVVNEYPLAYTNVGDGPAKGSFVADLVPTHMDLEDVLAPPGVIVMFSGSTAPNVPASEQDWALTAAQVSASSHFEEGEEDGEEDGLVRWTSPFGSDTTWVVALTDDRALEPDQLPTFIGPGVPTVVVRAFVTAGTPPNTVITNRAVIGGIGAKNQPLQPAVSNLKRLVVSPDAGLDVLRECAPDVVAGNELITLTSQYTNRSTNLDVSVLLTETLPDNAALDHARVVVWDESGVELPALGLDSPAAALPLANFDPDTGIFAFAIEDFGPLYRATVELTTHLTSGETGDVVFFTSYGVATGENEEDTEAQSSCELLVANPDIVTRKLVDVTNPIAGDIVTYTVTVENVGPHVARDVAIVDTLEDGLEYWPAGGVTVTTPGWSFEGAPHVDGQTLTWSHDLGNALVRAGVPVGTFPGQSGPVTFFYQARVTETTPDTTLDNCVAARQVGGFAEDDPEDPEPEEDDNLACVSVRTPLPDLYIRKTGVTEALGGATVRYTLSYTNRTRQSATGAFIADALPDWGGDRLPPQAPGSADGLADVRVVRVDARFGETVWYADAPLGPTAPTFPGPAWSTDPDALEDPPSWIGIEIPTIAGNAPLRSVLVDVALVNPRNGLLPRPGSDFVNCATIASATADDAPADNGPSCVTTTIPGVDVAVTKACGAPCVVEGEAGQVLDTSCLDPTAIIRPGDVVSIVLQVVNSGTENVYAIRLGDAIPAGFTVQSVEAVATLTDAVGNAGRAVDPFGAPIDQPIPWSPSGAGWVLGTEGATLNYQGVGLAPGTTARLIVVARVGLEVLDQSVITNTATVAMEQTGADPERYLLNNQDTCEVTVYRPDLRISKRAADAEGGQGPVGAGGEIVWTLGFNNVGQAPANGVVISDVVPLGTALVPDSFVDLPAGYSVRYYDIDGNELFPSGGGPDWDIYSFDIVFEDPTGAPLNDSFREDEVFEGAFFGTADQGGYVEVSEAVAQPSYTTPVVPTTTGEAITGWRLVTINDKTLITIDPGACNSRLGDCGGGVPTAPGLGDSDGGGDLWVTILDADGNPIQPFVDVLIEGGSGTVDISAIPAATYASIQVRVRFPTGPGPAELDTPQRFSGLGEALPRSEVWVQHENWAYGRIAGLWGVSTGNPTEGPLLAAWEKQGGEWILHVLQDGEGNTTEDNNVSDIERVYWGDIGTTFTRDSDDGSYQLWHQGAGGWEQFDVKHPYGAGLVTSWNGYEVRDIATCQRDDCETLCGFDGCPIVAMGPNSWAHPGVVRFMDDGTYELHTLPGDEGSNLQCYDYQVNPAGQVTSVCTRYNQSWNWIGDATLVWAWDGSQYIVEAVFPVDGWEELIALTTDGEVLVRAEVYDESTGSGYVVRRHYHDGEVWTTQDLLGPMVWLRTDTYPRFGPDSPSVIFDFRWSWSDSYISEALLYMVGGTWQAESIGGLPLDVFSDANHGLVIGQLPFFVGASVPFVIDLFGESELVPLSTNAQAVARYVLSTTAAWGDLNITDPGDGGDGDLPVPAPLILGDNETNSTGKLLWTGGEQGSGPWTESFALRFDGTPGAMWFAQGGNEAYGVTGNLAREPNASSWQLNHAAVWELENRDADGNLNAEPLPGGLAGSLIGRAKGGVVGGSYFGSAQDTYGNDLPVYWRYEAGHHVPYRLSGCVGGTEVMGVTPDGVAFGNCNSGAYNDPVYWVDEGGTWVPTLLPAAHPDAVVWGWNDTLGAIEGVYPQLLLDTDNGGYWFYDVRTLWVPDGAGGFDNVDLLQVHPELEIGNLYYYGGIQPVARVGDRIVGTVYTWSWNYRTVVWDRVAPGQWQLELPAPSDPVYDWFRSTVAPNGDVVAQTGDTTIVYRRVEGAWQAIPLYINEGHANLINVLGPDPSGLVPESTTRVVLEAGSTWIAEIDALGDVAWFELEAEADWFYFYFEAQDFAGTSVARTGHVLGVAESYEPSYRSRPVVFQRTVAGYEATLLPLDGISWIDTIRHVGGDVFYAAAYDEYVGDYRLILLVRDPLHPDGWSVIDVTPAGMALSDYQGVAPELSPGGVTVAWFSEISNEGGKDGSGGYHLYVLRPTFGGGYVAEPLGITEQRYEDEPGNWISGECWILDGGLYFWGCGLGLGTGSIALDNLSVSYVAGDPEVSFRTEVTTSCFDTVQNRAVIGTDTPEITADNNEAFAEIGLAHADLSVRLTVDKGVAAVDEVVTWTARLVNLGPEEASDVQLDFVYPDGVTPLDDAVVTIDRMRKGEQRDLTFSGQVIEAANGVPLSANVSASTVATDDIATDCRGDNDVASATVISGNFPNVWVTKSCPTSVAVGDIAVCTIDFGNNGNAPAYEVTVTDTLPAGTTIVPGYDPLVVDVEELAPGESGQHFIAFEVTTCIAGDTVVNHVAIAMNPDPLVNAAPDANAFDNEAADDTLVLPSAARADIEVFASRPAVEAGELVTFTAEVVANGGADIEGSWITMTVPANATLVDATPGGAPTGNVIRWERATLPAGASGSVSITVQAPAAPAELTASAETGGSNVCPVDPADTVIVEVDQPGLHITKAASRRVVCDTVDTEVRWSIWVTNTTDAPISGIVVTDAVPAGLGLVGGSISGVGANAAGFPNLSWNVGTLQPGQGVELGFATQVPTSDGALVVNRARVSWQSPTGTSAMWSNEAPVRVQCDDAFRLSKAWDAACNAPGDPVTVTLRWRNDTGATQASVVITDVVEGFTEVDPGTGTYADGTITWTLTNVAAGASGTLTWSGEPTGASGDLLTNVAIASGPTMMSQTSNVAGAVLIVCPTDPDGNPCTADACDPGRGCYDLPEVPPSTVCSDGNACTDGDRCVAGACVGATEIVCNDDNACTADGCLAATGCVFDNVGDALCDDAIGCTVDSCDAALGCVNAPDDSACDDGNICTTDACDPDSEPGGSGCEFEPFTGIPEGGGTVSCGEDACGGFTGFLSCEEGVETSTCDPAYENILDTTCDDQVMVVYASVTNEAGDVAGTIRCTRTVSGGVVDCTRSEDPNDDPMTVQVFQGAMCPGVGQ